MLRKLNTFGEADQAATRLDAIRLEAAELESSLDDFLTRFRERLSGSARPLTKSVSSQQDPPKANDSECPPTLKDRVLRIIENSPTPLTTSGVVKDYMVRLWPRPEGSLPASISACLSYLVTKAHLIARMDDGNYVLLPKLSSKETNSEEKGAAT